MSQTIRVLIVDDHTIVRKGIRALLTEIAGIEVVGEAADGQEAIAQANRLRPDVISDGPGACPGWTASRLPARSRASSRRAASSS